MAGMILPAVSQSGDENLPNAMRPTPGWASSAKVGTSVGFRGPVVDVCWLNLMVMSPLEESRGKTVRLPPGPSRNVAGAGVMALIRSRIFSSPAVALCVVNTLADTTLSGFTPLASIAASTDFRYALIRASFAPPKLSAWRNGLGPTGLPAVSGLPLGTFGA